MIIVSIYIQFFKTLTLPTIFFLLERQIYFSILLSFNKNKKNQHKAKLAIPNRRLVIFVTSELGFSSYSQHDNNDSVWGSLLSLSSVNKPSLNAPDSNDPFFYPLFSLYTQYHPSTSISLSFESRSQKVKTFHKIQLFELNFSLFFHQSQYRQNLSS